ncbi:hypothetical protein EMIT0P2_10737 [Pseudomonas sp. IT-P2]
MLLHEEKVRIYSCRINYYNFSYLLQDGQVSHYHRVASRLLAYSFVCGWYQPNTLLE